MQSLWGTGKVAVLLEIGDGETKGTGRRREEMLAGPGRAIGEFCGSSFNERTTDRPTDKRPGYLL